MPVCVDSCPLRAIEFGPINELRAKYGSNADVAPLPDSRITSLI
ncbi:anaerobic dimethyl sulfoxide reductase chain B [Vibrio ishigakensis]|uniref:Anaerobic dimethyl sulfoxide reductase chain B n=1 Tax=Vibrio ishigakensis TaxID=1481914 RepID=A0A0B8Q906_9VIBR|nr:anaerobic dimethyl sulfoxide reductase chain B [Vibrio ishigakensis]